MKITGRIFLCTVFVLFGSHDASAELRTWDFDSVVDFCEPTVCALSGVQPGDPYRGFIRADTEPNSNVDITDLIDFQVSLGTMTADRFIATSATTDENGDFNFGSIQLVGTIGGTSDVIFSFRTNTDTWKIEEDELLVASGLADLTFEVDGDGLAAVEDNCIEFPNADQRDTDGDGIGNICDPDFDQSCIVNFIDLNTMGDNFFAAGDLDTDLDGDGQTNFLDLDIMKPLFFGSPGPSGMPNVCD